MQSIFHSHNFLRTLSIIQAGLFFPATYQQNKIHQKNKKQSKKCLHTFKKKRYGLSSDGRLPCVLPPASTPTPHIKHMLPFHNMTTLFKATNKKIGPTLTPHYLRRIKKGAHLDELESDALVIARPSCAHGLDWRSRCLYSLLRVRRRAQPPRRLEYSFILDHYQSRKLFSR